jgi:hypothetical protein
MAKGTVSFVLLALALLGPTAHANDFRAQYRADRLIIGPKAGAHPLLDNLQKHKGAPAETPF